MNKVLKHLKNNIAIYLILLVCIVIILIALFYKTKDELKEVDTSMFNVVTLNGTINLFKDNEAKLLVISNALDQSTVTYVDHLKYSMLDNGYKPYFLYQENIEFKKEADKVEELRKLINLKCTYEGQTKEVIEWIKEDVVPITLIIKNKKAIYAFIGPLNTTTLESLAQAYGIGTKNTEG